MTFTDDDLKGLKEQLRKRSGSYPLAKLQDLIARLEAAELCASQFSASFPDHAIAIAWRKVAGK